HKAHSELWTGGDATVLIMGLDNTTYLLGEFTRSFPTLLRYGGLAWFLMLAFGWLLVVLRGRARVALVALFLGGHASFVLTVRIGAFAYVAIAGLLLFFPPGVWDRLAWLARWAGGSRLPVLRRRLVAFAERVPDPDFGGERWQRARETTYEVAVTVIVLSLAAVLVGGALQAGGVVEEELGHDREIERVASSLAIDQPDWTVFAPTPRTTDRYYVFTARTADGEVVDAYNDRPHSYDRPYDELQKQFDTYRERFYMNSVRRGGSDTAVAPTLAEHACEAWAGERGVELTHLNIYVVSERVTLETIDEPTERERSVDLVYRHGCGGTEPETISPPPL
ncbi:MAG: HTTM domain-containing protein, partial [Halalkalicoccus sp.]